MSSAKSADKHLHPAANYSGQISLSHGKQQIRGVELKAIRIEGSISNNGVTIDSAAKIEAKSIAAENTINRSSLAPMPLESPQSSSKDLATLQVSQPTTGVHVSIKNAEAEGKSQRQCFEKLEFETSEDGATSRFVIEKWVLNTYELFVNDFTLNIEKGSSNNQIIYQPSCFEKCLNCCCQAYSCGNCKNIFNCNPKGAVTKSLNLTDSLQQGRSTGFTVIKDAVFSNLYIVWNIGREISVIFTFAFALFSLINNAIRYGIDQHHDDDEEDDTALLASLVITCVTFVLALIDFIYNVLWRPNPLKDGMKSICEKNTSENHDPENCCEHMCKYCPKEVTKNVDFARLLIAGLIFYPDLVMSVFLFSKDYIDNGENLKNVSFTTWALPTISFCQTFWSVYVARGFILSGTILSISKVRVKRWTGACFQIYFVIYSICQMILQMLMIIAIGARFHYEYRELNEYDQPDYLLSGFLWYMVALGYIIPLLSTLMFFLVHHYWTQKLSLDVVKDMMAIFLRTPGLKDQLCLINKTAKSYASTMEKINMLFSQKDSFDKDYKQYSEAKIEQKILYPFTSPFHIVVCIAYAFSLLAFFVNFQIGMSYSSDWQIFAVLSLLFGMAINVYALSVAGLYILILISILMLIMLTIAICLLFVCIGSSESGKRNTSYN